MAEDTTTRAGNGERVRLVSQERLDLPDTNALQTLVYKYVSRAMGAVLGPGSGVLSAPKFKVDSNSPFTFTFLSGFQAWDAWEDGYPSFPGPGSPVSADNTANLLRGGVVTMDLTTPGQSATIDLSGVSSAHGCVIWGKRAEFNGELDTRRKWDTTTQDEIAFSTETRVSNRVDFAVTEITSANPLDVGAINPPASWPDDHWFPILVSNGNFSGSMNKIWAFRPVNAWDSFAEDHLGQASATQVIGGSCTNVPNVKGIQKALLSVNTTDPAGSGRTGSVRDNANFTSSLANFSLVRGGDTNLIKQLWRLRNAVQRIVGYKSGTAWYDAPGYNGTLVGVQDEGSSIPSVSIASANTQEIPVANPSSSFEDQQEKGPSTFNSKVLGSFFSLRSLADQIVHMGSSLHCYFVGSGGIVPVAWGSYEHDSSSNTYVLVSTESNYNLPGTITPLGVGNAGVAPLNTDNVDMLIGIPTLKISSGNARSIAVSNLGSTVTVIVTMKDSSGSNVNDSFYIMIHGVRS